MSEPLVISIITATYNSEKYLADCFKSISGQTFKNVQHIVVDGLSKDATPSIIECYKGQIFAVSSERDTGIYDALNKGLRLATGDIVGFLHSDDIFARNDVLAMIAKAFGDPSVCAVYGDLVYVQQSDAAKVIRNWKSKTFTPCLLERGWMPPHPTLYVRREFYERIGGFDVNYRISGDFLSVLKLFSQPDFKAVHIPSVLVTMRLGGASNKSLKANIRKSSEDWRALRSSGFSLWKSLRAIFWKNISKLGQFL